MITPRVAQHKHRLSGTVPTISSTVWIGFSSFGPNRDVDKLYKPRILDSVHIVCNSTYKTTNQQPITRTIKVMQASSVVLIPVCVWVTISRSTSTTAPGAAGFNSTPGCAMLPSPALAGTSQEQLAVCCRRRTGPQEQGGSDFAADSVLSSHVGSMNLRGR